MATIVVTGGAGYIGSHTARQPIPLLRQADRIDEAFQGDAPVFDFRAHELDEGGEQGVQLDGPQLHHRSCLGLKS